MDANAMVVGAGPTLWVNRSWSMSNVHNGFRRIVVRVVVLVAISLSA